MDAKMKQAIDTEVTKLNDKRSEGERIVDTIFATIDAKQRQGEWIGDSAAALRADLAAAMDKRYIAGWDAGMANAQLIRWQCPEGEVSWKFIEVCSGCGEPVDACICKQTEDEGE